jgi:DNA mismatch repair protein MutS
VNGPSVLYLSGTAPDSALPAFQPHCFADLNLDAVVTAVTAGKDEYDLKPFFYTPLISLAAVHFRQAVMRDLEVPANLQIFKTFAKRMQATREAIARTEKRHHRWQKMRSFVDSVLAYGDTVTWLATELPHLELTAQGLIQMRDYVQAYAASPAFGDLTGEARALTAQLSTIRYDIIINRGLQVEVRPHAGAPDYGAQIAALFDRFDRRGSKDYAFEFGRYDDVNSIEGNILNLVAQTHPQAFERLAAFGKTAANFLDEIIVRFDRENQFYISYLDHITRLRKEGLVFCYPAISADDKSVSAESCFDLALAGKLAGEHKTPVANDFRLDGPERILVVTGPNQGGKTTFSRCFAQLHYLASLGCPVPGTGARLFLADQIFTHFERAESATSLTGKLQDDLIRIHQILEQVTPRSIVIINEIFASTTLSDAIALSRRIAEQIMQLDLLCVWVTFIDEITTLSDKTVSMVSAIDPEEPERRTFKIERTPANGLAYAQSLARKYSLTYDQILARVQA